METIAYNNRKLRIASAFGAAFYILFHGRPIKLVEAFTAGGFYVALAVSFSISLLLVHIVHTITVMLDRRYDWRSMPFERSVMQFFFGVLAPALADLMLISIYFHVLGENIVDNGFLLIDFPVILSFIVILNLYYLIHYLLLTEPKPIQQYSEDINRYNENTGNKTPVICYNVEDIEFNARQDILYFYRCGNSIRFTAFNGEEYPVKETLGSLAEQLKGCNFIQINRSLVLNFSIVEGYQPGLKRNTLELIFKSKYFNLLKNHNDRDQFVVTKEHISKVSDFFNSY